MTDKIKIVIEHVDKWKKKCTKKDYEKFTKDFYNIVEELKLTSGEAEEILMQLGVKVDEENKKIKDITNLTPTYNSYAFTQYASDFFATLMDDIKNDNKDESSYKDLIKE